MTRAPFLARKSFFLLPGIPRWAGTHGRTIVFPSEDRFLRSCQKSNTSCVMGLLPETTANRAALESLRITALVNFSNAFAAINSRRDANPLVRLEEVEERWEVPSPPPGCFPSKLGWNRAKSYCHLYGAKGYGKRQA
ncbi:hypothetical protein TNCV_2861181 [Trichonephila clavipes]|nr:hypothetical protein TNCV_2861181 [Trichonephila clavipes]